MRTKRCELCSHDAERGRKLCDDCANAVQRLLLVQELNAIEQRMKAARAAANKRWY